MPLQPRFSRLIAAGRPIEVRLDCEGDSPHEGTMCLYVNYVRRHFKIGPSESSPSSESAESHRVKGDADYPSYCYIHEWGPAAVRATVKIAIKAGMVTLSGEAQVLAPQPE